MNARKHNDLFIKRIIGDKEPNRNDKLEPLGKRNMPYERYVRLTSQSRPSRMDFAMAVKNVNRVDKHVGSRIRMRRLMLGKTQTELANSIGVTFQQVQKYEKGANRVSPSRLHRIAQVLQVPVPFFFEGAPTSSEHSRSDEAPDFVTDFCMTSDGLALAKAFMAIGNMSVRRRIVQLVNDLADEGA